MILSGEPFFVERQAGAVPPEALISGAAFSISLAFTLRARIMLFVLQKPFLERLTAPNNSGKWRTEYALPTQRRLA
jgi:hypothetical protein